jgi:hypothetical protein
VNKATLTPFLFLCILVQGCIQDPVSVSGGGQMEVRLRMTGGIAGADYTVLLDGKERRLVGESCVHLCDFEDGETLASLTSEQVDHVWTLFREAGILALDGEDFGVQCCDQFYFEVEFRDSEGTSRVEGSSEVLPQDLRAAVVTLQSLVFGVLPVIVNFSTDPWAWPQDPFQIEEAAVSGHRLQLRLSYGGGCRADAVHVVAWGGWMESFPVQVRLFVAHEDFDDPCDAWITRDFEFDLIPLKLAYEASYGTGEPGKTTLILLLADPMLAGPLGARWLEYHF